MKKTLFALISFAVLISCTSQTSQKKDEKQAQMAALTVDDLQKQAAELVGKEVVVKGTVTHVCKEAGARCFIMGSNEDVIIRIEAGKIGAFTQEQMGSDIEVRGLLREVQLDEADLKEMQQADAKGESANKAHALGHDGPSMHTVDGGKHDSLSQTQKLEEMSNKLAESKEGYVPVYYLDGIELVKK
jgi:hypothetical protein